MRALKPSVLAGTIDDELLFHRLVPMASLLVLQASYFVGRSVDFTLDMAIFPFCALAITAALGGIGALIDQRGTMRLLALIPFAIGLWVLTFTSLSLLRQNYSTLVRACENHAHCASAPYSLLLHECRDHARCSPGAVLRALDETVHKRAVIEKVGNPRSDWAFDQRGVVRDAMSMIETWAAEEPKVTVLVGNLFGDNTGDDMASDVALMYTGKWHRWPRSDTLTDDMIPSLVRRIIDTPIELREGELVLVRASPAAMGRLETGIFEHIKATATLCRLPHPSTEIIPYRVAGPAGCRAQ